MSFVITNKCVGTCDSACIDACPVDCIDGPISVEELQRVPVRERAVRFPGVQMFIDPQECICCSACVAVCPVDAIEDEGHAPAVDILRNAAFFKR